MATRRGGNFAQNQVLRVIQMQYDVKNDAPRPPRLVGLAPLVSRNTRLLVLGSFPSVASLVRQQYYAHPQNHFWPIIRAIWPASPLATSADSYEKRSTWMLERGLGVWDVYASCERAGSQVACVWRWRQAGIGIEARASATHSLKKRAHSGVNRSPQ